jgi:hypothetical protein
LKDQNFEIIAAAQDTGGEKACGKFYDRAKATYTTLIDPQHTVSTLYQMVNVPSGVWIDETGRIVRSPEVAYSKEQKVLGTTIGDNHYIDGLRDWVEHGADSRFVMSPEQLNPRLATAELQHRQADAHFKLATHFHGLGDADAAETHWKAAQQLHGDSWNYHRQQWSFDPKTATRKWFTKFRGLKGEPYYAPLNLPD